MTEQNTQNQMIPQDEYLKAGLHIGTKFRTSVMRPFIFKVRQDGLAVLDVQKIDERIRLAVQFVAQYDPQDILVICRRENGWDAVKLFSKFTGIKVYAGRYPPGILTNSKLENFTEVKLILVCDPFPDKNIVEDAAKMGIPVLALCDTNNELANVDLVIPCNNKGKKSLGLLFWILTKEYLKSKGVIKSDAEFTGKVEDFAPE